MKKILSKLFAGYDPERTVFNTPWDGAENANSVSGGISSQNKGLNFTQELDRIFKAHAATADILEKKQGLFKPGK
ncbi:hypothetical protein EGI22_16110 [Lacihabitans sp. LS3-19]|uniref:hypothetical protein n=1 Tax=Lacihabitans sp. LS3-19 TaxID=2487335 RepID=UPI0020CBD319|nr:hypothetical protein [Lacihabitans sp. LS3-19]MCP9769428.1 hypothetical protein [Lacihabitans sp. LS3-19]